jgi:hypothetical protein
MLTAVEPIAGTRGSLAAYFDGSLELLRIIANVLVLPQISDIVNKMLPHDALALASLERDGPDAPSSRRAWLHNFGRVVTGWERHPANFLGMMHLDSAIILLRHS